jgi:hypothetical protein
VWVDNRSGKRVVKFLADPTKIVGSTVTVVGSSSFGRPLGACANVVGEPCLGFAAPLVGWLRRLRGNASFDGQTPRRAEDTDCFRVTVPLAARWWAAVESGDGLRATVKDGGAAVLLFNKATPSALKVKLTMPSPVQRDGIRLQLSRKQRTITVLARKAAFEFGSRAPAELWLDDYRAWRADSNPKAYFCDLQMSDEDTYVLFQLCTPPVRIEMIIQFIMKSEHCITIVQ